MRCFRNYVDCVRMNDYWDVAGDLDCALALASCVHGAFRMAEVVDVEEDEETDEELLTALREFGDGAAQARGATTQRKPKLRDIMEAHRDEAHSFGKRVRDAGKGATKDKHLERDVQKFIAKVMREAGRASGSQSDSDQRPEAAKG